MARTSSRAEKAAQLQDERIVNLQSETKKFTCNCNVCKYANLTDYHLDAIKDHKDSAKFFEGMYNRLQGAEMDNDVNRAMLNGDWPSGKLVYVRKCEG